jgi:hypothetical protein
MMLICCKYHSKKSAPVIDAAHAATPMEALADLDFCPVLGGRALL